MARTQPAPNGATTGLTRRQLLERSAVMGGAVLAAQSLGAVSAFAQTSPPPPDNPPPDNPPPEDGTGTLPSNFQIVVRYNGGTYGVKYDNGWGKIGGGTACAFNTEYDDPPKALIDLLAGSVTVGTDDSGHVAYVLDLPDGVTFIEGRPKDGTCDDDPDKCGAPVTETGDGTYTFAACD